VIVFCDLADRGHRGVRLATSTGLEMLVEERIETRFDSRRVPAEHELRRRRAGARRRVERRVEITGARVARELDLRVSGKVVEDPELDDALGRRGHRREVPILDVGRSIEHVVAILFFGAIRLLRDAALVLLEASPAHLSPAKVERTIMKIEGVQKVHALHVWSLGTGHDAITAHVQTASTDPKLGARITAALRKRYVTIQVDVD